MPEFRTAYGPKLRANTVNDNPSMVKSEFQKEADINFIIGKFRKTGMVSHLSQHKGDYGTFDTIDFHEAMLTVTAAQEMFETVPADVRKRFGNDPGAFLDFVTDAKNLAEMRELGLAPRDDSAMNPSPKSDLKDPITPPAAAGETSPT